MKLDVLTVAIAACIAVEPIKAEEEGNYTYVPNPFLDPDAVEIDANQPLMLGVDIYPSRPERKPKGCASELHSGGSVRALCALYYQQELVFIGWQYLDASWVSWLHHPHQGSRL